MGEIGYDMNAFLYKLKWWQIVAISHGYRKRARTQCDMTRWAVFSLMNIFADLRKEGIDSPSQLIKFPWDGTDDEDDIPTDDEVRETMEELARLNREASKRQRVNP